MSSVTDAPRRCPGRRSASRSAEAARSLLTHHVSGRSQARTGATKPELLAAAYTPSLPIAFDEAEEAQLLPHA